MKKLIIAFLLLISIGVSAQTETESRYVWYKYLYGHRLDRMWADSVFHLPFTDTAVRPARPGALMMKSYDSSLAVWTGVYWASIGGAAGTVDATIVDGSANAVAGNAVFDALALKAALASPTFTGTPAAPTASPGTNTTQLATTAFVTNAVAAAGGGSVTLVSFTDDAVFDGTITDGTTTPTLSLTINAGSIALTKIANIANSTILGNNSGGAGPPLALTTSQVKTLLDLTGTNSGDVTLAGQNYITIASQVITAAAVNLSGTHVTGTLAAARFGALTGDVTNSAGSYATTIANLAITNAKVNDVGWSKITGTPTTLSGYGITDAMGTNVTNTMGASGRIVFDNTSASNSQFKIGEWEFQNIAAGFSHMWQNAYYNGTNQVYRTTGYASAFLSGGGAWGIITYPSGTAGATLSTTNWATFSVAQPHGVRIETATGLVSYLNFGATPGVTGYGIRDSLGTIQFKNLAGSWTGIGSGSGSGSTDLSYTASPTNGVVASNTGTDATLTLATATNAGLLPPGKFAFVDSLQLGLINDTLYVGPNMTVGTAASGADSLFIDGVTATGTSTYLGYNSGGTWGLHSTSGFGGGVTTMAAIGSSPNANGATISSTTLNLQPASASFGGVITTGAQELAGAKNFNDNRTRFRGKTPMLNVMRTPSDFPATSVANGKYNGFGFSGMFPDGVFFMIWSEATHHLGTAGVIKLSKSIDQGKTWTTTTTSIAATTGGQTVVTDAGGITPTGRLIVAYMEQIPWDGVDVNSYSITNQKIVYSDDQGVTWSSPVTVSPGSHTAFSFYGPMNVIAGDSLMLSWYGYTASGNYSNYIIKSGDDGVTWPTQITVSSSSSLLLTEPSYCYLGGSAIVGIIRDDSGPSLYEQFISTDNGNTWTDQGKVSFGAVSTPAWLASYAGLSGKREVVAYHRNGTEIRAIYASSRDLINVGETAWDANSLTTLATGVGGNGYPFVNHPYDSPFGFGAYYDEETLLTVADLHHLVLPINNSIPFTQTFKSSFYLEDLAGNGSGIAAVDNDGKLSWAASPSGGSPAGSTTQIQYNNAGAFGASANLTYNGTIFNIQNTSNSTGLKFIEGNANTFGIWAQGVATPSLTNYALLVRKDGTETYLGSSSYLALAIAGVDVLSATVTGAIIQTSNSGIEFREYTASSSVYAIYPLGVTPGDLNFAMAFNNTGDETTINALDAVNIAVDASNVARFDATQARIHSLGGDGTGIVGVDNDGDLSYVAYASGTYTPTITLTANSTSGSATVAQYVRVGSTVTVSGSITFTVTAGSLATECYITLPVASAIAQEYQLAGTGFSSTANNVIGKITGEVTNNAADFSFFDLATGVHTIFYHFTYQVL
jgi:hypothetical protein